MSLPRAIKLALGKEIFAKCFFFADSFLFGSRQRSVCAECFSVPGVLYFALGEAFFAESFLFCSRHRNEL
jgi:hypothetical protein